MTHYRSAGWPPDFHFPEAIKLGREAMVKVAKGIDPRREQKAASTAQLVETAAAVRTVAMLAEAYTQARSQRWRPATARAFKGDLREIVDLPARFRSTRSPGACWRLRAQFVDHRAEAEGHRGTRVERLRMLLGSTLSCLRVEREWVDVSPAQRLPLPAQAEADRGTKCGRDRPGVDGAVGAACRHRRRCPDRPEAVAGHWAAHRRNRAGARAGSRS